MRYAVWFLLLLPSCVSVNAPKYTDPKYTNKEIEYKHSYCIRIRPFIADGLIPTNWSEEKLQNYFRYAKAVYSRRGVDLVFLQPILVNDYHHVITGIAGNWHEIVKKCSEHAALTNEMPVWFVNSLYVPNVGAAGGISTAPDEHMFGMVVSSYSHQSALAHELGHQLGLFHIWEYFESDCMKYECDSPECKFNVMGYCNFLASDTEFKHTLNDLQALEIFHTLNIPPKNILVIPVSSDFLYNIPHGDIP